MTPRVVCIGVATLDAIVVVPKLPAEDERVEATDGQLAGGGVAATAAVTLARLGVPVAFIGGVGDDTTGRWIRDDLAREGVDVSGLRATAGRSRFSVVLVHVVSGSRALAPFAGEMGTIELTSDDMAACDAADWIHLDHVGYAAVHAIRRAGVTTPICLDGGNPIPGLELTDVDLYAPTDRALRARHPGSLDAALRAALDEGPRLVVATRGAAGSIAAERHPDGTVTMHEAPGYQADVVSTLGAGDVFHGALLAALLDDLPLPDALHRANATAAMSTRALDGRSAIPTRVELDAYLTTPLGAVRADADR